MSALQILPLVRREFADATNTPWMTFALYMGLICGAFTWSVLADFIGRRLSFNITLFLGGVFGLAAGAAPSFTALGGLLAALGFGIGGSLPVDGMLFLEFVPGSHQYLLTLLSVFWSIGQLFASLIAWAFVANYTCVGSNSDPTANGPCDTSTNVGWRYTIYVLGAVTLAGFFARFLIFQLPESPKFLLSQGRDAEAVAVVRDVARRNGKTIPEDIWSVAVLRSVAGQESSEEDEKVPEIKSGMAGLKRDLIETPKRVFGSFKGIKASSLKPNMSHVRLLFATKKLAYNTCCMVLIWGLIGLGYPLYNAFLPTYLSERRGVSGASSVNETYKEYVIISACGVPGSIIAAWLVELPRSGRRGALAISTLATGVFIFALTGAPTNAAYLGLNCAAAIVQNMMYGVLYNVTPETFPTHVRGFGDGLCASFNRVTGSIAPLIAIFSVNASAPLYVSGALFVLAAIAAVTLTVETQGRSAL